MLWIDGNMILKNYQRESRTILQKNLDEPLLPGAWSEFFEHFRIEILRTTQ